MTAGSQRLTGLRSGRPGAGAATCVRRWSCCRSRWCSSSASSSTASVQLTQTTMTTQPWPRAVEEPRSDAQAPQPADARQARPVRADDVRLRLGDGPALQRDLRGHRHQHPDAARRRRRKSFAQEHPGRHLAHGRVEFDANIHGPWRFSPTVALDRGASRRTGNGGVRTGQHGRPPDGRPGDPELRAGRSAAATSASSSASASSSRRSRANETRRFPVVFVIDPEAAGGGDHDHACRTRSSMSAGQVGKAPPSSGRSAEGRT